MTTVDTGIRVVVADTLPPAVVWRAFVEGFRGYLVPVEIDEEAFAALIASEHVDLSVSLVALDHGGDPVGICLLAIRGEDGWCGGLGVTPAGRRQGLGRRLMADTIQGARARALARMRLECIVGNTAARELYLGLGFRIVRRLDLFAGHIVVGEDRLGPDPAVGALARPEAVWTRFAEYHEARPPWQHDLPTLTVTHGGQPTEHLSGLGVGDPARPEAYVLYRSPRGAEGSVRIVDSGHLPGTVAPEAMLAAILSAVAAAFPGQAVRAANVPEGDPLNVSLRSLGVPTPLAQEEMELVLTS